VKTLRRRLWPWKSQKKTHGWGTGGNTGRLSPETVSDGAALLSPSGEIAEEEEEEASTAADEVLAEGGGA
jgi:hypothetical protein